MDSRRYLSTFAVFALVLLRLVIGWHFFREGGEKLEYNRHSGELKMVFSAAPFLANANGPLAGLYRSQAPDDHSYRELLTVPHQNEPPTAEQTAERAKWQAEYNRRRADAEKAAAEVPVEFAPTAPFHAWAEKIATDWRAIGDDVKSVAGLTEEQLKRVDEACQQRLQQLADYLSGEEVAMTEYRHELWRLDNWRHAPEVGELPFQDARITTKATETKTATAPWLSEVKAIETAFKDDLRGILTTEQRASEANTAALDKAITDPQEESLHFMNVAVTILTVGVGICLLLGFFTRTASIVGALFLLSVIAAQPPWLADSAETMPQCIEMAGLLVLAGTGAGRWMGLDYFSWAIFRRRELED